MVPKHTHLQVSQGDSFIMKANYNISHQLEVNITLDPWVKEIMVDPISKSPLSEMADGSYLSACSFIFGRVDGIPDLKINLIAASEEWLTIQNKFEAWIETYFENGECDPDFNINEQEVDSVVYSQFNLEGKILDVGGS